MKVRLLRKADALLSFSGRRTNGGNRLDINLNAGNCFESFICVVLFMFFYPGSINEKELEPLKMLGLREIDGETAMPEMTLTDANSCDIVIVT